MSKREKIILAVMAAAILYGVFSFTLGKSERGAADPQAAMKELNDFVVEVAAELNRKDSKTWDYVLTRAAAGWRNDPFRMLSQTVQKETLEVKNIPTPGDAPLAYTGFIIAGDRKLAIINGIEYETGDVIERGGYRVGAINEREVVIERGVGERLMLMIEERL